MYHRGDPRTEEYKEEFFCKRTLCSSLRAKSASIYLCGRRQLLNYAKIGPASLYFNGPHNRITSAVDGQLYAPGRTFAIVKLPSGLLVVMYGVAVIRMSARMVEWMSQPTIYIPGRSNLCSYFP